MNRAARNNGFTLIELMLAMTFISILLLAIAMTIIQVGNIYNKGMTLKDITQAGRAIGEDVKRTTSEAPTISLAIDYVSNSGGGRLCLGTYSYIWNTAKAIQQGDVNLTSYDSDTTKPVNLVKVSDAAKIYCAKNTSGALTYKNIRSEDTDTAQELLPPGDHNLTINRFDIPTDTVVNDTTTGEMLSTLHYTLGSGSITAMNSDQSACLGPNDLQSDLTYCSVQPFSLVLRTGYGVN